MSLSLTFAVKFSHVSVTGFGDDNMIFIRINKQIYFKRFLFDIKNTMIKIISWSISSIKINFLVFEWLFLQVFLGLFKDCGDLIFGL